MLLDPVAEERADVAVADVAGGVAVAGRCHQVLPGALGDHDDGVLGPLEPLLQFPHHRAQAERVLRGQAEGDVVSASAV